MKNDVRPALRAHDEGYLPPARSRVLVLLGEITPTQIDQIIRLFSPPEHKLKQ